MSFKSGIPWPKQPANLPTYEGGSPGKASVRKAEMEVGGMGGIRRTEWTDANGDTYVLNTRNGFPEVVTTRKKSEVTSLVALRGFLAHIVAATKAALFSPYTLAVLKPDHKTYGHTYTVLPFATKYNVPDSDTTKWCDVLSFHVGVVLVNGKAMPLLNAENAPLKSLPWIIPATSVGGGLGLYGDAITNQTVRRVFAISRDTVYSWYGVSETLTGATYRSDDKALVCGAMIERPANKAWLSQLVYTGYSWDSLYGGWGYIVSTVAMSLAAPHLEKTDSGPVVELPTAYPILLSISSGQTDVDVTLTSTEVGLIGSAGEVHATDTPSVRVDVWWPWTGAWKMPMSGHVVTNYSERIYQNGFDTSGTIGKLEYSASAYNRKTLRNNVESKGWHTQHLYTPANPDTVGQLLGNITAPGSFYWQNPSKPDGPWGDPEFYVNGGGVPGEGAYETENQNGVFSVVVDGATCVHLAFTRDKSIGTRVKEESSDRLGPYLADPYGYVDSLTDELGRYCHFSVLAYSSAVQVAVDFGKIEEMTNLLASKAGALAGISIYDTLVFSSSQGDFYTSTIEPEHVDNQTLTWQTKDFILYDKANGVFISIDGNFSGTQAHGAAGKATLTVSLKIKTPVGEVSQELFIQKLTYIEMLQEVTISDGVMAVPSPRMQLMFTPLFQEQGDFKGAVYTTSDETAAVPSYLFNFVLKLGTYYDIGAFDYSDPIVTFIPCNLIELLYETVYSTAFGVDEFQRYPVESSATYNSFMTTLFAAQWRVNYRDGVLVDWLDALGTTYITETTTELFRL